MKKEIRVRFAPSPTGPLHIGGVRTALYNFLFAKQHGGRLILRIEDTDQTRYVNDSERYILEALTWCGITFDEGPEIGGPAGPYRQSERKPIYRQYAEALVGSGNAYYAFDTPEELAREREELESEGKTFNYNWESRGRLRNSLSIPEVDARAAIAGNSPYVIRFKAPRDKELLLNDIIRGEIRIDSNILDDKVLFKSDGMPTYHLANIVDDHLMNITHVIRGEEWLPSLALHTLLYEAFNWECPEFAHLPLIMKPEGKGKLSKRDGEKLGFPVYPLKWGEAQGYRECGYFPEAVINFLAMLGWNPGTEEELFSLEDLISRFSLQRVNKSGARFDPEKTKWYNHQYLQKKTVRELALLFKPVLAQRLEENLHPKGINSENTDITYIEQTVGLLKERVSFVSDFWDTGSFFYIPPGKFDQKAVEKHWQTATPQLLSSFSGFLSEMSGFSSAETELQVKEWMEKENISFGKLMAPLRLALVGGLKGPHIFDIMALLGKQECRARIQFALEQLPGKP
jgi:glutamyl-tRNA synthetase